MEMAKEERCFREVCKSVACRIALYGVLLLGAGILFVGLPLAILNT